LGYGSERLLRWYEIETLFSRTDILLIKTSLSAAHTHREPRGERRKRETRARLLEAALRLMAEKGVEGVTINEITQAADVGFGSFYNHFESKEAIYAALLDGFFEEFGAALARLARGIADPAETISVCVRHTLLRARYEPVWGKFLMREGFSAKVLERGLGQRLLRDIEKGVKAKRFMTNDVLMMCMSAGGTVLAAISVELHFGNTPGAQPDELARLGFSVEGLPERTAAALLRTLGIDQDEAEAIAHQKLPSVEKNVAGRLSGQVAS
jgi:AcrR family transcriptional regulator